jgi:hypothetical protein
VRSALKPGSRLQGNVRDGLAALSSDHKSCIEVSLRPDFSDSLDLDAAMRADYPSANRWDYLLGDQPSRTVIGLEPHSARQDEISTVIKKRKEANDQLRPHLKTSALVVEWFWVASGRVHFANTEKTKLQLDENGIRFVGTMLCRTHLSKLGGARK